MKKMIYIIFLLQAFIFNLTNVITPHYLNGLELPKYTFGYFSAIWSLGMLISSPLWGRYASKYGRKNIVISGVLIYGISQLGFYFFENIFLLSLLRLVSGIGVGAIVTMLLSHLILNTDPGSRAKALSYRLAFITGGSIISYQVSGYLGEYLVKELFLYQSILSIVFLFLIILFVKDKKSCIYPKQYNMYDTFKYIKNLDIRLVLFLLSITFTTMTIVNLDKFIDLYLIDMGHELTLVSNVKMMFGIIFILTNFILIPSIKKILGHIYILQTIQVLMSIVILLVFMKNDVVVLLYSVFLIFIVLKAVYQTSEQVYVSKHIQKEDMNLFVGIRQSFTCLGMILGPIIGGHIYSIDPHNLFIFNAVCLLFASVLISYMKFAPSSIKKVTYNN